MSLLYAYPFAFSLFAYNSISSLATALKFFFTLSFVSLHSLLPNLLIGGIAFRDQIYITRIPVIKGINLFDFVDIDPSEINKNINVDVDLVGDLSVLLEDLYNTEFKIQDIEDKKICIYF